MDGHFIEGFYKMFKPTMCHCSYRRHILNDVLCNSSSYFFPSFWILCISLDICKCLLLSGSTWAHVIVSLLLSHALFMFGSVLSDKRNRCCSAHQNSLLAVFTFNLFLFNRQQTAHSFYGTCCSGWGLVLRATSCLPVPTKMLCFKRTVHECKPWGDY